MAHAYKTPLGMHALLGAVFLALAGPARDCRPAETQQTKPRNQHQDVFDAWTRRAQRVQSLHFEWTQQEKIPKGSLGPLPVAEPQWPPRDPVIPSEDVTVEARFSLMMDDPNLRLWEVGEFFRQDLNRTVPREYVQVSTSVEYMHIALEAYSGHPYAGINRSSNRGRVSSIGAQIPFRLAYRMYGTESHPWFSNDWEIVKRYTGELDTRACTVLDLVWQDHPELTGKLWLAHRRDFLPLRYTSFHASAARETGDGVITFEESAAHGPILKSWTLKQYDMKGNLTHTYVSTVKQYAINVPIPDDKFEVDLPEGTGSPSQPTARVYPITLSCPMGYGGRFNRVRTFMTTAA